MLPEIWVVVPALHWVPSPRTRAASGADNPPSCQNTEARPLLGATTRSEMLSASTGPASGVWAPQGPLFGRSTA